MSSSHCDDYDKTVRPQRNNHNAIDQGLEQSRHHPQDEPQEVRGTGDINTNEGWSHGKYNCWLDETGQPEECPDVVPADGRDEEDDIPQAEGNDDNYASGDVRKPTLLKDFDKFIDQEFDKHCVMGHFPPCRGCCIQCIDDMVVQDTHRVKKKKGNVGELKYDYTFVNAKDNGRVERGNNQTT